MVDTYSLAEAAERAGMPVEEFSRLVELGVLGPHEEDHYTRADVRKAGLIQSMVAGGLPVAPVKDSKRPPFRPR